MERCAGLSCVRDACGGAGRFVGGLGVELVFSFLLTPIMALSQTAAIAAFFTGRSLGWPAQTRGEHRMTLADAARRFGPHGIVGIGLAALLGQISLFAAVAALPVYGGLLVAIPLAIVTSGPGLGRWMARNRVLAIPEDIAPPDEIVALDLPALRDR